MRALFTIGILVFVGLGPALPAALAAPMDGSAPILCAVNAVFECTRGGGCERSSADEAEVPGFVRVNVPQKQLQSVDGSRTSPIAAVQRQDNRLMLQGMQNDRVWGAVINEQTGQMSATVGEDDGAIVISGTCIAP